MTLVGEQHACTSVSFSITIFADVGYRFPHFWSALWTCEMPIFKGDEGFAAEGESAAGDGCRSKFVVLFPKNSSKILKKFV